MTRLARIAARREGLVGECDAMRDQLGQSLHGLRVSATLGVAGWAAARVLARRPGWGAAALAVVGWVLRSQFART